MFLGYKEGNQNVYIADFYSLDKQIGKRENSG